MSGWEFLERHWFAAGLLIAFTVWCALVGVMHWAKKNRPVTIVMEVPEGSESAGTIVRQAVEAFEGSKKKGPPS